MGERKGGGGLGGRGRQIAEEIQKVWERKQRRLSFHERQKKNKNRKEEDVNVG